MFVRYRVGGYVSSSVNHIKFTIVKKLLHMYRINTCVTFFFILNQLHYFHIKLKYSQLTQIKKQKI